MMLYWNYVTVLVCLLMSVLVAAESESSNSQQANHADSDEDEYHQQSSAFLSSVGMMQSGAGLSLKSNSLLDSAFAKATAQQTPPILYTTTSTNTETTNKPVERFDMFERIYNMADLGYINAHEVKYVLDVGAFQAEFSSKLKSSGRFPHAHFILIEANRKFEPYYQSLGFPYVISLVGDQDDEVVEYYRADPTKTQIETGNSIFREESTFFDEAIVETRQSYTIDTIIDLLGLSNEAFQILKLDVQGSEIRALRGAKKVIQRSPNLVIITEASFVPYNGPNSPTFFDIALEMEQMNFQMVDILGYSEAAFDGVAAKMPIQFDVAWMHRDRIGWRGKKWPKRSYHIDIEHGDE